MAERARAAEALMSDVQGECEKAVAEVFATTKVSPAGDEEQQAANGEVWKPVGGDAVLQAWEQARLKKAEPSVISKMKKLALLGS